MHDLWPESAVPEDLQALLRVAARTGATLVLRGDVARLIERVIASDQPPTSILDRLPPLSQLVVDVIGPQTSRELAADFISEIRREWPWAGFFSLTLSAGTDRSDLRLVRVIDQPKVLIAPDRPSLAAVTAASPDARLLAVTRDVEGRLLYDRPTAPKKMRLEWQIGFTPESKRLSDVVHDLIWLAAERAAGEPGFDDPSQVVASLAASLTDTRTSQDSLEQTELPLLRYLLLRGADDYLEPAAAKALREAAERLPGSRIADLVKVLDGHQPFRAVVTPNPSGGRRIESLETGPNGSMALVNVTEPWMQVAEDCRRDGLRLSNPVSIEVWGPPPCCRYRDFARGIAEVIWSRPEHPIVDPRLPVVYLPYRNEIAFASGYLSAPAAASLRADFGLLGYLLGRRGQVEVAAVWKTAPESAARDPAQGGVIT